MHQRRSPAYIAGLAFLAGLALPAAAPTMLHAQAEAYRGTWVLNPAASDDVDAAIARAVRGSPSAVPREERARIRSSNEPYSRLRIADDNAITIEFARGATATFGSGGAPVRWRSEKGEVFEVTTRIVRGRLEQRFVSGDGRRTNTYVIDDNGGTLTVQVAVETTNRLSRPLVYNLVYERAN